MATITPTTTGSRHILGDLDFRHYVMPAVVSSGDTLTVPQSRIENVIINATTSGTTFGVTISGSVITFLSSGPWTGSIGVLSRIG